MALRLEAATIEDIPQKERESKWRGILEEFMASETPVARVNFEGETKGTDGKPVTAQSAQSGLAGARKNAGEQFEDVRVSARGDTVYLVRKSMLASNGAEQDVPAETE